MTEVKIAKLIGPNAQLCSYGLLRQFVFNYRETRFPSEMRKKSRSTRFRQSARLLSTRSRRLPEVATPRAHAVLLFSARNFALVRPFAARCGRRIALQNRPAVHLQSHWDVLRPTFRARWRRRETKEEKEPRRGCRAERERARLLFIAFVSLAAAMSPIYVRIADPRRESPLDVDEDAAEAPTTTRLIRPPLRPPDPALLFSPLTPPVPLKIMAARNRLLIIWIRR